MARLRPDVGCGEALMNVPNPEAFHDWFAKWMAENGPDPVCELTPDEALMEYFAECWKAAIASVRP